MDDDNLNQFNIKADFGCHFRQKKLKLNIVNKKIGQQDPVYTYLAAAEATACCI